MQALSQPPSTHRRPRPIGRVLFALSDDDRPTATLRRAAALAASLGAELSVVRVLDDPTGRDARGGRIDVLEAVRLVERTRRAMRSTTEWLSASTSSDVAPPHVALRVGDFVLEVTREATDVQAELVVIPPRRTKVGDLAATLARAASVPVLVGRDPAPGRLIVAATDLEDPELRVLRKAAEMGRATGAPLVAVHNVSPVSLVAGLGGAWPLDLTLSPEVARSRRSRLARASASVCPSAETVVATQVNAVEAIVREARDRRADLVIVGARPRSWMGRLVSEAVASHVVDRAEASVLVLPLDRAASERGRPHDSA